MSETFEKISKTLSDNPAVRLAECRGETIATVPPAGDVEVLAKVNYTGYEPSNHLDWNIPFGLQRLADGTELVDRAHATRLQAELEQERRRVINMGYIVQSLQSELTRALDLLSMGNFANTPAHREAVAAFLAHQSASAAKMVEMSNQYVSVPRATLQKWVWRMRNLGLQELPEDVEALLFSAPAEDVRAVVDEPVACYVATDDLAAIKDGSRMWVTAWASDSSLNPSRSFSEPLYRHPQRPIVLPEPEAFERLVTERFGFGPSQLCLLAGPDLKVVFDACLDEFARLNP